MRKNENWTYPEPLLSIFLEFYEFADNFSSYASPNDKNYARSELFVQKFQSFVLETNAKPEVEPEVKTAWQELYKNIINSCVSYRLKEKYPLSTSTSFLKVNINL
jgi:hypothetical protein